MTLSKPKLTPGARHPITITATGRPVTVRHGEHVVAKTGRALTLAEAKYAPVQYIPLEDVDSRYLRPSEHETYCPFKGDASYYSLSTPAGESENAVWTYEQPHEAVAEIAGHVAFYPDRVTIEIG